MRFLRGLPEAVRRQALYDVPANRLFLICRIVFNDICRIILFRKIIEAYCRERFHGWTSGAHSFYSRRNPGNLARGFRCPYRRASCLSPPSAMGTANLARVPSME